MTKHIHTLIILFLVLSLNAQPLIFKTILPNAPVVAGESFTIQYVINNEEAAYFKLPYYAGFRVVSGPNVYPGKMHGKEGSTNFMITIVAEKPGRYMIPGATVTVSGKMLKSNNSFIEVIPPRVTKTQSPDASSGYYLSPGENMEEKLRKNLFVRVMVDKKKCYVGEPVTATFKLYSRLESRSDIVKNPGFYGFTVYDVINLEDKVVASEQINGKVFDVHTIRKVQLYPLSAGKFQIDPMEVRNTVEFSRSLVNKKTEQEITEGILHPASNDHPSGAEIAENEISTESIEVNVIALPETRRPVEFTGAVGEFTLTSTLSKPNLYKNEEGTLEVIVSGKGNFTQLNPLPVAWPKGVEGFDPVIEDALDAKGIPLTGMRIFRYPFIASTSDSFVIPPVRFAYFNPDTGQYKTITGASLQVIVQGIKLPPVRKDQLVPPASRRPLLIVFLIIAGIITSAGIFYWRKKNAQNEPAPGDEQPIARMTAEEVLSGVITTGTAKEFYETLYDSTWLFLKEITGKENIQSSVELLSKKARPFPVTQLRQVISECESAIYTGAEIMPDREQLLAKTKELFLELQKDYSEYL